MAMTYAEAKESLMGIGYQEITLAPASGITASDIGKIGTISGNGEWGLGADAGTPYGVLKVFETDRVGVQIKGFVEIDIEHDTTSANEVQIGDWVELDGAGKGAKSTTNKGVIAVAVDATNHKAIVYLG